MSPFIFKKIKYFSSQKIKFFFEFKKKFYQRTYDFGESFNWDSELNKNILVNLGLSIFFSQVQNVNCSKLVIENTKLKDDQINFWRNFMVNISGQKFYLEKKRFSELPEEIISNGPKYSSVEIPTKNKLLLGLGGGKESLTTESIFSKAGIEFDEILAGNRNFFEKRNKKIKHSRTERKVYLVNQKIQKDKLFDSKIPIAVPVVFRVALIGLLFCHKYGYKHVVAATEKSSNYGNSFWDGRMVNHQYDKTSEFLEKANEYIGQYITPSVNFFSSLEGLYEYKIAEIFSRFPSNLKFIISCNFATIEKPWCLNCYKCSFTYVLLCAFIDKRKIDKIISEKMFNRLDLFKPLMIPGEIKPFECIGTKEEIWLALNRCVQKEYRGEVLDFYKKEIFPGIRNKIPDLERKYNKIYSHNIPSEIWKKIEKLVI